MNKVIIPSKIGNNLFAKMKQCKTQLEMESIWEKFKNETEDSIVFMAVEQYLIKYKNYYFYTDINGHIAGCIKERILGEL